MAAGTFGKLMNKFAYYSFLSKLAGNLPTNLEK